MPLWTIKCAVTRETIHEYFVHTKCLNLQRFASSVYDITDACLVVKLSPPFVGYKLFQVNDSLYITVIILLTTSTFTLYS